MCFPWQTSLRLSQQILCIISLLRSWIYCNLTKKALRLFLALSSAFFFFHFFFSQSWSGWKPDTCFLSCSEIRESRKHCRLDLTISYDITSNCCWDFVTLTVMPLASQNFFFLCPNPKPLNFRTQLRPLKLDQRIEWGKGTAWKTFITNHRIKLPTSFPNTVWTGEWKCKLGLCPTTAATSDNQTVPRQTRAIVVQK